VIWAEASRNRKRGREEKEECCSGAQETARLTMGPASDRVKHFIGLQHTNRLAFSEKQTQTLNQKKHKHKHNHTQMKLIQHKEIDFGARAGATTEIDPRHSSVQYILVTQGWTGLLELNIS